MNIPVQYLDFFPRYQDIFPNALTSDPYSEKCGLYGIMTLIVVHFSSRRYPSCYVCCTELYQEAQRPVSSQDVGSEEESEEKIHHHQVASAVYYHSTTTHLIAQRFHRLLYEIAHVTIRFIIYF